MKGVFKAFHCAKSDKLFISSGNIPSPKCEEFVRNIYPKTVYQLHEKPFDKLRAFDIEIAEEKTLFNNFAVFDFESICVKDSSLIDGENITWIGEHEPISVSVTSNLLQEQFFICDNEPHSLVSTFVTTFENLEKSRLEMSLKLHDIGATIKGKLERVMSAINKRRPTCCSLDFQGKILIEAQDEKIAASTQFL